jgi:hypothetical protein
MRMPLKRRGRGRGRRTFFFLKKTFYILLTRSGYLCVLFYSELDRVFYAVRVRVRPFPPCAVRWDPAREEGRWGFHVCAELSVGRWALGVGVLSPRIVSLGEGGWLVGWLIDAILSLLLNHACMCTPHIPRLRP